jgi:dihydroxy-acid dehydratase
MLNGRFRGKDIGSGTDVFKFVDEVRAGVMSIEDFVAAESAMARSPGHCMTMGTASTMASMAESLGVALPGNAAYPAVDAHRARLARMTGRRAVAMVNEDQRLSKILTKAAFGNAIRMNGAIGGSTNAVLHLIAIARRIGVDLGLDDWEKLGHGIPTIVNLMPSGKYLMEDFCYAGGIPAVMKEMSDMLDLSVMTATGKTLGENIDGAVNWNPDVILPRDRPLVAEGGIAVLRGNLAPLGAVLKPSAASQHLMKHFGPAVVFNSIEHYKARVDDPDLAIDENSVMVLQNCGPKGYPGMAEVGNMALPQKLLKRGVRDMVRISDARMSGTAFGTVVLHVAPEAAVGGPLALVRDGDTIELDVAERRLHLEVSDEELERRRKDWAPTHQPMKGGYQGLYVERVMQADTGVDFDFLVGCRGHAVPRESH